MSGTLPFRLCTSHFLHSSVLFFCFTYLLSESTHDIIDTKDMALFLHKVRDNMIKIPKATYREKEKRWMMTVPASASVSGKRYPVYGATEQEVLRNYILQVEFKKGEKVPILEEYLFSYLKTFVLVCK